MRFQDREQAGKILAEALAKYKHEDAIIYALPRGGAPLAQEIRKELRIPLSLIITRKIGHPASPEYAICSIAEDGHTLCNEFERSQVNEEWFKKTSDNEIQEIKRRKEKYLRDGHTSPKGKIAIIVDDGIATGLTMRLAVREIKHDSPAKVVVAVPVSPNEVVRDLRNEADEVIVLSDEKNYLGAVGSYYDRFPQVSDEEVIKIING